MCSYFQNVYLLGTKSALTQKTFFLKKNHECNFLVRTCNFYERYVRRSIYIYIYMYILWMDWEKGLLPRRESNFHYALRLLGALYDSKAANCNGTYQEASNILMQKQFTVIFEQWPGDRYLKYWASAKNKFLSLNFYPA